MVLCRESARPAIAVKFDNQHALGISRHLHGAIGAEVVSLMGLHCTLLGLLRFARNDISTRSEFQPARSSAPPLQLSSLSASWARLPVAWQTGSDRRRDADKPTSPTPLMPTNHPLARTPSIRPYRGGSTISFCNAAIDGR
jgi:hypothetical protein